MNKEELTALIAGQIYCNYRSVTSIDTAVEEAKRIIHRVGEDNRKLNDFWLEEQLEK